MFHPIKDETSTRVDTEKPYYFCCILLMALQKTSALSLSLSRLVDAPLESHARGSEGTKELRGPPARTVLVLSETMFEGLSSVLR